MKQKGVCIAILFLFTLSKTFASVTYSRTNTRNLSIPFIIDSIQISNASSCTICNGSATVWVSGGFVPYTFLWSNNATTQSVTGLCPGRYSVLVLDANNDTISGNCNIEPDPVNAIDSITNTCTNTGIATMYPLGGMAPYSYLWTGGATTQSLSGLTVGTYKVTITDMNGCNTVDSAKVLSGLGSMISTTNVMCYGDSNGTATVFNVTGGTSPYTYIWEPLSGANNFISGLSAGRYTVSMSDNFGCSGVDSVTIIQPTILMALVDTIPDTGSCSGKAKAIISGGVAPYSFTWSSQGTNTLDSAGNLCYGVYFVCANDANGCSVCDSVYIRNATKQVTGIVNIVSRGFDIKLYPNPAKSQLNLLISGSADSPCNMEVYDMMGRQVMQKKDVEINGGTGVIDVSTLATGSYMLRISDKNHNEIRPFLIGF